MSEETPGAAGTANPAAGPAPATTTTGSHPPPDKSGFLNVIFHGLFCFFELEHYILVRVPFIPLMTSHSMAMPADKTADGDCLERTPQFQGCPSEHVYLAGSWLGERVLNPGRYELKGVDRGFAHFDRTKNLVIQNGVPAAMPHNLYAEIRLPYPLHITSVQQANAPRGNFSGGDVGRLSSEYMSLVQVLTYKFQNEDDLQLSPHRQWDPEDKAGLKQNQRLDGFVNLHLFAGPDHHIEHHVGHAFGFATTMFDNLDLKMETAPAKPARIRIADLPFGTLQEEMQDLEIRTEIMAFLGLLRKRGENLNKAFDFNSPLITGSDPERCAPLIGG